jgi:folate-binding protein YgfZ
MIQGTMAEFDLTLDDLHLHRITRGAVIAQAECAVFDVRGAGSLDCLQGLLTNDLVKPGPGSVIYGALLTPKGMLVVDLWVLRRQDALTLVAPLRGREAALETFRRTLPPRLAQVTDRTGEVGIAVLLGEQALEAVRELPFPLPDAPGRLIETGGEDPVSVARPPGPTYFQAILAGPERSIKQATEAIERAGALPGGPEDIEASRILAGWPALGAEIDGKTLPQEVRFDEMGGLSYTKGCYMGQETVARLHFRGHPNRELRGLVWIDPQPLTDRMVLSHGKEVGTIRSTLTLPDRRLGLAPLRREVALGEAVMAGGLTATVVSLPFSSLIEDAVG